MRKYLIKKLKAKRASNNEDGFTLVELLVVLAIISLLSAFVFLNVLPAQDKGMKVKAKGDIRTLEMALEMYHLDMFDYPEHNVGLDALVSLPSGADADRYRKGGYIKILPNDPWGRPYIYRYPGDNGVFDILSYGADGEPGGEDKAADIVSWEQ